MSKNTGPLHTTFLSLVMGAAALNPQAGNAAHKRLPAPRYKNTVSQSHVTDVGNAAVSDYQLQQIAALSNGLDYTKKEETEGFKIIALGHARPADGTLAVYYDMAQSLNATMHTPLTDIVLNTKKPLGKCHYDDGGQSYIRSDERQRI